MNRIRDEFEAEFPVPETALYADGEYVWTTHPTPHSYNQMYLAWCAAHAKYTGDVEPVAVADNGVLNWLDGKQFDCEADLYTHPLKTIITDRSKWRVDDLVQDVNGDIFTIEGFKGDKLLIKDASENLWLTLADELTWHSRATQEEQ